MTTVFGVPLQALFSQLLVGLINGSFYALLSLGLAIIFGLLGIVNFAHGALYMLGALVAWLLLEHFGIGYWPALIISPLIVGLFGALIERTMLKRIRGLDPIYSLLLTFGLALVIRASAGTTSGSRASRTTAVASQRNEPGLHVPPQLPGLGGAGVGAHLHADLVRHRADPGGLLPARRHRESGPGQAFGINVPRMITLTYGLGVALAALAGVMAAPICRVSP